MDNINATIENSTIAAPAHMSKTPALPANSPATPDTNISKANIASILPITSVDFFTALAGSKEHA